MVLPVERAHRCTSDLTWVGRAFTKLENGEEGGCRFVDECTYVLVTDRMVAWRSLTSV
jgi:hypothetical protein